MKIKTNLNRLNRFHDNVNYLPIEVQVKDFILSTGLFKDVRFKTTGDQKYFILDDKAGVEITYDQYGLTLSTTVDKYNLSGKRDSFYRIQNRIYFKEDNNPKSDDTESYLKLIVAIAEANQKADAIIAELPSPKELAQNIQTTVDDYFQNDLIKCSFSIFASNLIPKLDNEYTSGIWSWLSFNLKGIKQEYSKHDKHVSVELFVNGKIKNSRMDEFVKAIQCTSSTCKPSVKDMANKLALVADFEDKLKTFDGTKLPYLKEYLAIQKKGAEFRKKLKLVY